MGIPVRILIWLLLAAIAPQLAMQHDQWRSHSHGEPDNQGNLFRQTNTDELHLGCLTQNHKRELSPLGQHQAQQYAFFECDMAPTQDHRDQQCLGRNQHHRGGDN